MLWKVLRVLAVLIGALLFLLLPMALRDSIPDGLFNAWDAAVTVLRTPINSFWWQFFHRYDQQPLFTLFTLLTQALAIVLLVEGLLWLWRRRTA